MAPDARHKRYGPAEEPHMEIIIGDKVWSSWSMRPWLVLKHTGEAFTETLIHLRTTQTEAKARAAGSPNIPRAGAAGSRHHQCGWRDHAEADLSR